MINLLTKLFRKKNPRGPYGPTEKARIDLLRSILKLSENNGYALANNFHYAQKRKFSKKVCSDTIKNYLKELKKRGFIVTKKSRTKREIHPQYDIIIKLFPEMLEEKKGANFPKLKRLDLKFRESSPPPLKTSPEKRQSSPEEAEISLHMLNNVSMLPHVYDPLPTHREKAEWEKAFTL